MQDFETRLRDAFGQVIDEALGIKLLDAAYYVDDFRLAVQIPRSAPGLEEREVRDAISTWLQRQLDLMAPGLMVEQSKTTVTVEGRDRRFLVPQSLAAQRIQSDTSGVFDMLHGTELIGAIEGFFHTQKRYSTETKPEEVGRTGLLVGLPDMRDETAARFAAGRFRRTFRSLRPILDGGNQGVGREVPPTDEEPDDEGSEHKPSALKGPARRASQALHGTAHRGVDRQPGKRASTACGSRHVPGPSISGGGPPGAQAGVGGRWLQGRPAARFACTVWPNCSVQGRPKRGWCRMTNVYRKALAWTATTSDYSVKPKTSSTSS